MTPKAIIFDFDGLILDTEWPEVQAWEEIYRSFGCELPRDQFLLQVGRGADQGLSHPCDSLEAQLGHSVDRVSLEKLSLARRLEIIESEAARPGIIAMLDEADSLGVEVAIASSSRYEWVDRHLRRLGLRDRFSSVSTANDVSRTKPDPELYLLALRRLSASPSEVFALEDSPPGATAARAAGLFVIAYPNPLTAMLDLSIANVIIENLEGKSIEDLWSLREGQPVS